MTPTTPAPRVSLPKAKAPVEASKSRKRALATFGMLFLVFFGGLGGSGYYYRQVLDRDVPLARHVPRLVEHAPFLAPLWEQVDGYLLVSAPVLPDSGAGAAAGVLPDDSARVDSTVVDSLSSSADSAVADALSADSIVAADSTESAMTPVDTTAVTMDEPVEPDPVTGHLLVRGVEAEASLWIDGQWVRGRAYELTPGAHQLKVAAPGKRAYTASILIVAGDTVRHQVSLETIGQCDRIDRPLYNAGQICFDAGPRLRTDLDALIGEPETLPRRPSRPAVLVVEVRADGTAGTVIVKSPSDVPEFGIKAVEHAKQLRYRAALKSGVSVAAWAELSFRALP